MMFRSGADWNCGVCGRTARRKIDIARHVEARHVPNLQVTCQMCDRVFKTRDSMRKHHVANHA